MPKNGSRFDAFATAYDARDLLPELSAWMSDDALKLVTLWHGPLEGGQVYFDLRDPDRGAFTAEGGERPTADTPYTCRRDVPEWVWAQLTTWRQPVDESQGDAIAATIQRSNGVA